MALTLETPASTSTGSVAASSLTLSVTIGNNANRYLGAFVGCRFGQTVSSVVLDPSGVNQALTKRLELTSSTDTTVRNTYWDLVAPSVGTFNLVVTFSANTIGGVGAYPFYNARQATPTNTAQDQDGTAPININPAVTITSAVGDIVTKNTCWERTTQTLTQDGALTADWNMAAASETRGNAGGHIAGASSITITDTLSAATQPWVMLAVSVQPFLGGRPLVDGGLVNRGLVDGGVVN